MSDTEMMQRVVGVLTQAREMWDNTDEDGECEGLTAEQVMMGELIDESLSFDTITLQSADPQDVADAVMKAVRQRVGSLAGCFVAAFTHLAVEHDSGNSDRSADILRNFVLRWELGDDEPA